MVNHSSESDDPEFIEGPINMILQEHNDHHGSVWFLYIMQAHTGRFYVGISCDPKARLKNHNSGKGSRFARQQGPFELLYISKPLSSKSEARKREIQVKGWSRDKKQKLISGEWE